MGRRANLLVVCRDFPIQIRSYTYSERYRTVRKLAIGPRDIRINLERIKEKIKELQKKYPDKGFYFERHEVTVLNCPMDASRFDQDQMKLSHKMICWIIGRRNPDPKLRRKDVPVYWSPKFERLYVPKSYYERNKRLTCSVISYRLRDLGIPFTLAQV